MFSQNILGIVQRDERGERVESGLLFGVPVNEDSGLGMFIQRRYIWGIEQTGLAKGLNLENERVRG